MNKVTFDCTSKKETNYGSFQKYHKKNLFAELLLNNNNTNKYKSISKSSSSSPSSTYFVQLFC
jgi:hypothetical protein